MRTAGFELAIRPGTWGSIDTHVKIDFLVPRSMDGTGRRGARLGTHGADFARKATGLEAAIIDHSMIRIAALEPSDTCAFSIFVASVPALLVAKLHKIADRGDDTDRTKDKDGLDVLRLLTASDTQNIAEKLHTLSADPIAGPTTIQAREFLKEFFGDRHAAGTQMAVRTLAGLENETEIAMSCEVLASTLLKLWI